MSNIGEEVEIVDNFSEEDTQKDKFLSFIIASEVYAIEITFVTEIIGIQKITPVPNITSFIKGIINLRGNIIPVVDVRARFKLPPVDYTDRTCIIVVNVESKSIGLIVDEVSEVLIIPEETVSLPPSTNKGSHSRYIQGIGKLGNDIKIILNINKLLYNEDMPSNENE